MQHYKYPSTPHLPWSRTYVEGKDSVLKSADHFKGKEIILTEKCDGENTNLYRDHYHARSMDSGDHPSRHYVKAFHAGMKHRIPEGWRICGENLFAMHSIFYNALPSYFLVFSIWNERNICLSWDETESWCMDHGLISVPVLYRGIWEENKVKACFPRVSTLGGEQEGYVVCVADEFAYEDFATSMAKFVRKNHVQTDEHWLNRPIVPNKLR